MLVSLSLVPFYRWKTTIKGYASHTESLKDTTMTRPGIWVPVFNPNTFLSDFSHIECDKDLSVVFGVGDSFANSENSEEDCTRHVFTGQFLGISRQFWVSAG